MSSCDMNKSTELRDLAPGVVMQLSNILDGNIWKQVMAAAPVDPNNLTSNPMFKTDHIRLVETHGHNNNRSCTELFINEWGTLGKIRPTLETLLNVFLKLKLYRAANYILVDLLKEPPVLPIDSEEHTICVDGVMQFEYSYLTKITDNWNDADFQNQIRTGNKLGGGAFGSVYFGVTSNNLEVAVKRLKEDSMAFFNQFQNEITALSNYRHKNLVPLIGYSHDGPYYCIVYQFMPNRSLQDCLLAGQSMILSWRQRLIIAIGVCEGIHFLHTSRQPPLIHRDIKTANILLDKNMEARIGDFGLVKTCPTDSRMTSTIFGTSPYMAPEAFRGDISVKTDVFSVGVVLLELLTALLPYDDSREGADLVTYVEETVEGNILPWLDPKADWEIVIAEAVFNVAQICIDDKKKRPTIAVVINLLSEIFEGVSQA